MRIRVKFRIMTYGNTVKNLGKTVRKLRKSKDMTQEQLAEAVECNVDTISNVERGAKAVRLDTIVGIAEVFGVEVGELFDLQPRNLPDEILRLMALLEDQPSNVIKTVTEQAKVLIRHKK